MGGESASDSEWIVHTTGGPNEGAFEITVLRRGNTHGQLSYGWFDKDKILISHNGGPCTWTMTQMVWIKLLRVAQEVADALNEERI